MEAAAEKSGSSEKSPELALEILEEVAACHDRVGLPELASTAVPHRTIHSLALILVEVVIIDRVASCPERVAANTDKDAVRLGVRKHGWLSAALALRPYSGDLPWQGRPVAVQERMRRFNTLLEPSKPRPLTPHSLIGQTLTSAGSLGGPGSG